MFKIKNCLLLLWMLVSLLLASLPGAAQIGSSGSISIKEGGSLTIFGQHHFLKGSGLIKAGMITTERSGNKGYLNFAKGSSWEGADENNYVDGYVRVFHDQAFVLPLGQDGIYRPIQIEGGTNTRAAYYAQRPPNAKDASQFDKEVADVSASEYWDIQGDQPITISLSWDQSSKVSQLVNEDVNSLRIVGFKNGKWTTINSTIEKGETQLMPTANANTRQTGVITASEKLIPNDYEYFTLGTIRSAAESRTTLDKAQVSLYPNPVRSELFVDLEKVKGNQGIIQIYNLYGQLMIEQDYDPASTIVRFDTEDYLNGLYEVRVRIDHKEMTRKFTVQRLY